MDEQINITGVEESLFDNSFLKKNISQNNKMLSGKKIAISVSVNEDLERNGLSEQHINDISIEIARYIISNGGTALYGGDLRIGGFTEYFSELSNQYKIVNDRNFRFINYFPFPNSKRIDKYAQADFKSKQIEAKILEHPIHLNIDYNREYEPFISIEDRYVYCECFKDMRVQMAKDCMARILVGGKTTNFLGYIPGVIEEALLTLNENKPIFLVGGFGGATEKLINLIKGYDVEELTNEFQYNSDFLKKYKDFVEYKCSYSNYENLRKEFVKYDIKKLSDLNSLSIEENEILFSSKNIHEIVRLLMKGLMCL